MFGIRFIKSEPTTYLMAFQGGKIVKQGAGLSFLYFGNWAAGEARTEIRAAGR